MDAPSFLDVDPITLAQYTIMIQEAMAPQDR